MADNLPSKRGVHKRTLALVYLFIVMPWILVAMAGASDHCGLASLNSISHKTYGWPFVHMTSVDRSIPNSQTPPATDEGSERALIWDARLQRRDVLTIDEGELGIPWSSITAWPSWKEGMESEIKSMGFALNLMLLAFAAFLAGWFIERRIRRVGRLIQFSLRGLFLFTALVSAILGWGVYEHRRESQIHSQLEKMSPAINNNLLQRHVNYQSRFPFVVSQLLNHGNTPWGKLRFFSRIHSGRVISNVYSSQLDNPHDQDSYVQSIKESPFPIFLRYIQSSVIHDQVLERVNTANIEALVIEFDQSDWAQSFEEAKPPKGHKNGLFLSQKFTNMKYLTLQFDNQASLTQLDQVQTLKSFCNSPKLEFANLINVNAEGAAFVLQSQACWPKELNIMFADDVPDSLRLKLEKRFTKQLSTGQ